VVKNSDSFIIKLNQTSLDSFKSSKLLVKPIDDRKYMSVNREDNLLIMSEAENKIVGEYEVSKVRFTSTGLAIEVEPIYDAPPTDGVKIDDLTLIQLSSYSSISHWKYTLRKSITKIKHNDYNLLSRKLLGH
jgi:hypothetical protein